MVHVTFSGVCFFALIALYLKCSLHAMHCLHVLTKDSAGIHFITNFTLLMETNLFMLFWSMWVKRKSVWTDFSTSFTSDGLRRLSFFYHTYTMLIFHVSQEICSLMCCKVTFWALIFVTLLKVSRPNLLVCCWVGTDVAFVSFYVLNYVGFCIIGWCRSDVVVIL